MKNQTFEKFLEETFISFNEYRGTPITKDNCEELLDDWLAGLSGSEYVEWGELYGRSQYLAGKDEILNKSEENNEQLEI